MESHLHNQIVKYIYRQKIVLSAMRDIRPDLVMRTRGEGIPKDHKKITRDYIRSSQLGFWGKENEWEYFIHGIGCRLKHIKTQEPIDWDSGDLRRFDLSWFISHLEWSIIHESENKDVSVIKDYLDQSGGSLQDVIKSQIEILRSRGILSESDGQQRYTLLSIEEPI